MTETEIRQRAYDLGAGRPVAPSTPKERQRFRSWMRGHCWACAPFRNGEWQNTTTRMLWAAWRDRAALAEAIK